MPQNACGQIVTVVVVVGVVVALENLLRQLFDRAFLAHRRRRQAAERFGRFVVPPVGHLAFFVAHKVLVFTRVITAAATTCARRVVRTVVQAIRIVAHVLSMFLLYAF